MLTVFIELLPSAYVGHNIYREGQHSGVCKNCHITRTSFLIPRHHLRSLIPLLFVWRTSQNILFISPHTS